MTEPDIQTTNRAEGVEGARMRTGSTPSAPGPGPAQEQEQAQVPQPRRELRVLEVVLAFAIAVSIVHYSDNIINIEDYPRSPDFPNPGATTIAFAFVLFTISGIAGWFLLRRGHRASTSIAIAFYSASGLVGFGHYLVPGALSMPWWRQAHVITDIVCGVILFALAVRLALRGDEERLREF